MSNNQDLIISETIKILTNKGLATVGISSTSRFLTDLGMDSLDLATLIVTLEDLTQRDPFREGFKTFHTVAELAALYEQVGSK